AFRYRPGLRVLQCRADMLVLDMEAVAVVEPTVPGLGDHRHGPRLDKILLVHLPGNNRVADDADAMGIGDQNGAFEETGLFDPGRAGHLAVAIQGKPGSEDGVVGLLASR